MGSNNTTNKKQEDFIPNEKFSGELKEKDKSTFKSETKNDIKNNKGQNHPHNQLPNLEEVIEYPSLEEIKEMNKLFDDNGIECPICLEPYTESIIKKKIICGHCFCYICISKAIQILPLCPLCRKNIDYNKEFTNLTENEGINLDISQKRMEESKEISSATTSVFPTQNWNVHTLRNILSNDNDFTRQNNNFFRIVFKMIDYLSKLEWWRTMIHSLREKMYLIVISLKIERVHLKKTHFIFPLEKTSKIEKIIINVHGGKMLLTQTFLKITMQE